MIRLYVLCEGQTEESFVNTVMAPHLATFNIATTAPLLGKPGHKGGNVSWARVLTDVRNLLRDTQAHVTSFLDYYGIDQAFPGRSTSFSTTALKAQAICNAMRTALDDQRVQGAGRFIPYIQMYEFEGLLFSDPAILARSMGAASKERELKAVMDGFATPEDINDGRTTAPSKRVLRIYDRYQKVQHGTIAAKQLGLPIIRTHCPLFDAWVRRLEALSTPVS
jgi:Domain of unknown function (DUF4276)